MSGTEGTPLLTAGRTSTDRLEPVAAADRRPARWVEPGDREPAEPESGPVCVTRWRRARSFPRGPGRWARPAGC
jgi:hypothetical protein